MITFIKIASEPVRRGTQHLLSGELAAEPTTAGLTEVFQTLNQYPIDFADVRGQEAAKRALDAGATHYTTRPGLDALRQAVAQKLGAMNGINVDPARGRPDLGLAPA